MSVQFPFSHQAFFVDIEDSVQLFHEAGGYSRVNSAYLNAGMRLMKSMIAFRIPEMDIMLITFYAAQKHCYNRLIKQKGWSIEARSVDGSQGEQVSFIILDNVMPGGA